MVHVKKGCLTRLRNDVRSDGSRIESFHRHLNNLQRSLPSGLRVFRGLAFDFVHRRNIRITHSSTTLNDPFVTSSYASHHIFLVDFCNKLQGDSPLLPDVPSGETFGIVVPEATWLDFVKSEGNEEVALRTILPGGELDHDLEENTRLRLLTDISDLNTSDFLEFLPPATHPKLLMPPTSSSESTSKSKEPEPGILGKRKSDLAMSSMEVSEHNKPEKVARMVSFLFFEMHFLKLPFQSTQIQSTQNKGTLASFFSSQQKPAPPPNPPTPPTIPNHLLPNIGELPPNLTPTQLVFKLHTGKDPRSQVIEKGDEWFLFMDLRAQYKWRSFDINWKEATKILNDALFNKHPFQFVRKEPLALHQALFAVEKTIDVKISSNNFSCESS